MHVLKSAGVLKPTRTHIDRKLQKSSSQRFVGCALADDDDAAAAVAVV